MSIDYVILLLLFLLPMLASLILFFSMIATGKVSKAIISALLAALLLFILNTSLPDDIGKVIGLMFGPWIFCIVMFFASLNSNPQEFVPSENRYRKPQARVLNPCSFYDEDGKLLTNEASLDRINSFDRKSCDDFLNSIGHPLTKKEESLRESRLRCINAFKRELID
ncbi:MAG: hypothetical protein V4495_14170 [Pseudomonadota bacterium]